MRPILIIEQIDEEALISDEAASNKWILEIITRHRVVVKVKQIIEANFILQYLIWRLLFVVEDAHFEVAIVNISASILIARLILLDLFQLYEALRLTAVLVHESLSCGLQVKHHDPRLSVILLAYDYHASRSIVQDHGNNRIQRCYTLLRQQVVE